MTLLKIVAKQLRDCIQRGCNHRSHFQTLSNLQSRHTPIPCRLHLRALHVCTEHQWTFISVERNYSVYPSEVTLGQEERMDAVRFGDLFERLIADLTDDDAANPEVNEAAVRFKEVLRYNVPDGKRNRGLSVISSFRFLANSSQLTESNLEKAMVLGWCVELLQSYFLIADDMMDQSKKRRGKPCWYLTIKGHDAINDSFFVEACIYKLLKKYICSEPYYVNVLELFHETNYQTIVGQALDLFTSPENENNLDRCTQERYDAIVKWKTAFYSFYLPVALAMYMVEKSAPDVHDDAKTILLEMGNFFQVQDDFLDSFGDPSVIGKIGTDIEENKCSWLVVQALKLVTPEQRKLLEDNYGKNDEEKVSSVKELYKELDLEGIFYQYEEESYEQLMRTIDLHSGNLPKEMFIMYAQRIFKRKK